jgi:branched-chain amino acid aminotransferase
MNNPTKGTHEYQDDPRNADIIIDINGEYFARDEAKVSVFDSGFVLGDGVWEGLRVHQGRIAFLDQHLERLLGGAKALDMEMEVTVEELGERLYRLLEKNNMREGVHIRLMVSRGVKATPYQDPRITITQLRASSCLRCMCVAVIQTCKIQSSTATPS